MCVCVENACHFLDGFCGLLLQLLLPLLYLFLPLQLLQGLLLFLPLSLGPNLFEAEFPLLHADIQVRLVLLELAECSAELVGQHFRLELGIVTGQLKCLVFRQILESGKNKRDEI